MAKFGFSSTSASSTSTSSAPPFGFSPPNPFGIASTAPQTLCTTTNFFGSSTTSTPNSAPSPPGFGHNAGFFGSNSSSITAPSPFGTISSAAPHGSTGLFGTTLSSPFGTVATSTTTSTAGSTGLFDSDSGTNFVPVKNRPCFHVRSRNSTSGLRKVAAGAKPRDSFAGAPPSSSVSVSSPGELLDEILNDCRNVGMHPTGCGASFGGVIPKLVEDEDQKSDAVSEGSDRDDVRGVSSSSTPPMKDIVAPDMTSFSSQVHITMLEDDVPSLKEVVTETSDSKPQSELSVCLKPEVAQVVETQTIDVVSEKSDSKHQYELSVCMNPEPEAAPMAETQTIEEEVLNETPDSTHQSEYSACLKPEATPVVETQMAEKCVNETSDSHQQSARTIYLKHDTPPLLEKESAEEVVNETSDPEHQSASTICLKLDAPPLLEKESVEEVENETSDSEHQSGVSVCLEPKVAPMVESQSTIEVANETSDCQHQSEVSGQNESNHTSPLSLMPLELALSSHKTRSELNGPILQQILQKYGDITKGSTLKSWEAKGVFVQLVVEAVEILNARTIETIEAEEIQTVQKWTDDATAVGFNVGWLQQRIKDIVANTKYQELSTQFDKITEQIVAAKASLLQMELKQMALKKEIDAMNAGKGIEHLYQSELSAGLF